MKLHVPRTGDCQVNQLYDMSKVAERKTMATLPPLKEYETIPRVKSEPTFPAAAVNTNSGFESESSGFRSRNGSSADSTRSSSPSPPNSALPLTLLDKIQVWINVHCMSIYE